MGLSPLSDPRIWLETVGQTCRRCSEIACGAYPGDTTACCRFQQHGSKWRFGLSLAGSAGYGSGTEAGGHERTKTARTVDGRRRGPTRRQAANSCRDQARSTPYQYCTSRSSDVASMIPDSAFASLHCSRVRRWHCHAVEPVTDRERPIRSQLVERHRTGNEDRAETKLTKRHIIRILLQHPLPTCFGSHAEVLIVVARRSGKAAVVAPVGDLDHHSSQGRRRAVTA
jgi:hypothetical protein